MVTVTVAALLVLARKINTFALFWHRSIMYVRAGGQTPLVANRRRFGIFYEVTCSPIRLDTALNLLWAAISVAALLWFVLLEWNRGQSVSRRARLSAAVCSLPDGRGHLPQHQRQRRSLPFFPAAGPHAGRSGGFGSAPQEDRQEKDSLQLARMLETLEHYQASGFYLFTFALYCIAIPSLYTCSSFTRSIGCDAGRAPPGIVLPRVFDQGKFHVANAPRVVGGGRAHCS